MKNAVILAILSIVVITLNANPIAPRGIARVWFDDANDFFVQFGNQINNAEFLATIPGITFRTSSGPYNFPEDFEPPTTLPWTVNLTQAIPGFTIDSAADHLVLQDSLSWAHNWEESLFWGPDCNTTTDLHALAPGQSAVQVYTEDWPWETYAIWAKDIGTAGDYYPVHDCLLNVHVEDGNGNPVEGLPIYSSPGAWVNTTFTLNYTDSAGNWQMTSHANRRILKIFDPLTQIAVVDTILYPEPDEVIQINAVVSQVANDDPILTPRSGILTLSPSVLTRASGNSLHLKFESSRPLLQMGELTLYDLRGRALAKMPMPCSGQTEWTLPSLSNGIYFIGLSGSGRQLASQRLTIIK